MRLDMYIFEKKGIKSRSLATRLITSGAVTIQGKTCTNPAKKIEDKEILGIPRIKDSDIVISNTADMLRYVSRAGLKLEHGLLFAKKYSITPQNGTCLDIGSSTGGFTDCLLKNGARKVVSVDVGTEQLDQLLRNDERVILFEKTDIRNFNISNISLLYNIEITFFDMIVVDVSFISLEVVLLELKRFGKKKHTSLIALIKPQFEAGKKHLNKSGIVTDPKIHIETQMKIKRACQLYEINVLEIIASPIFGGDGNAEFLLIAQM